MALHEVQCGFRAELLEASRDYRQAVIPGWEQYVEKATDPRPVGRSPEEIAGLPQHVVRHLDPGQVPEEDAVRMERPLRRAGRARRVDQERGIVGPGTDWL